MRQHALEGFAKSAGLSRRDEEARHPRVDYLGHTAHGGSYDWNLCGHRLEEAERRPLPERGEDEDVRRDEVRNRVVNGSDPVNPGRFREPQFRAKPLADRADQEELRPRTVLPNDAKNPNENRNPLVLRDPAHVDDNGAPSDPQSRSHTSPLLS